MIYQHREWAAKVDALLREADQHVVGHQSIDVSDKIAQARDALNFCPKCGAIKDDLCLSGGYAPVGELPGDPTEKPHRERSVY